MKISLGFILIALAGGLGCKKQSAVPAPPTPVVTVAPVEQKELVEWSEYTGRAESVERVEVRPRVSGHIVKVAFEAGQMVKAGDLLFEIDPRYAAAELKRREAEYQQAMARHEMAVKEAARIQQLIANNAISAEEAEQRQTRLTESTAATKAAEAARDSARLDVEHSQVRSPIAGKVSRAFVTLGNYVSGMAGGATLLTTVVSIDPIHVYADVDENSFLRLNELAQSKKINLAADGKIPVLLQLADEADFVHTGVVESFDNRIDPQSGSMVVRAVFPNPHGKIIPGLFARIRLPGSEKYSALLVDEKAIGTDQAQKFVLTLTETNTVAYRSVKLGPSIDGKRIIRSGLKPGEKVVVNGLQRVRPGSPVQAQTAPATPSTPTQAKALPQ